MSATVEEQIHDLGVALRQFLDECDGADHVGDDSVDEAGPAVIATTLARDTHVGSGNAVGTRSGRSRSTSMLVAACCVVVVGLVGVMWATGRSDEQRPADAPPPSSTPAWYTALAPLLPDGFEHVAITQSGDSYVHFEAFNPSSSKTLHITVSRTAMPPDPSGSMTLADARSEPWTDAGADHNISLPDGRQIGLFCRFRPMPDDGSGCPDVGGDPIDPEMLRAFALALATDLDPDDLPGPTDLLDDVPVEEIKVAIGDVADSETEFDLQAPQYGFSWVQRGEATQTDLLNVRTVTGYYPPLPADTPRTTASFGPYRLMWQVMTDGSVWYVSDSPESGLDAAGSILDRATGRPDTKPSSTTRPNSPEPHDVEQVAVLEDGALEWPASTPSEAEVWVRNSLPTPGYATAVRPDGSISVVSWSLLRAGEWGKTFATEPTVQLNDGDVIARLEAQQVPIVSYALQTDEGVFTASAPATDEAVLADWMPTGMTLESFAALVPPEGYTRLPDLLTTRDVRYAPPLDTASTAQAVTLTTQTFSGPIDLEHWAAATSANAELAATRTTDVFEMVRTERSPTDPSRTFVWQPTPTLIAIANTPEDRAETVLDNLTLIEGTAIDALARTSLSFTGLGRTAEPLRTVVGATQDGRFAFETTRLDDGTICEAFEHVAFGGSGICGTTEVEAAVVVCGSGWSFPDEAHAYVFVLAPDPPDVSFSINDTPADTTVESGTTDGIGWHFISVRQTGHTEDPVVDITIDGTTQC